MRTDLLRELAAVCATDAARHYDPAGVNFHNMTDPTEDERAHLKALSETLMARADDELRAAGEAFASDALDEDDTDDCSLWASEGRPAA